MARLNIARLKEVQVEIEEKCRQEQRENLTKELVSLVLDRDLKHSFQEELARAGEGQSKRVLSYWAKKGVIRPQERPKEGGWFYFDRTESIWIDIVAQLREFGLELDKILKVRDALFVEEVKNFRTIDFCLMYSIIKEPYLMIIYADGSIGLMSAQAYGEVISQSVQPPHIVFNFYFLAKSIFPNNNFNLVQKDAKTANLSTSEMKILYYLRTGDYKEMKVRLNDGEVYFIEATRKIKSTDRIATIISEAQFQNIEIKVDDNRIIYIEATEKIKL